MKSNIHLAVYFLVLFTVSISCENEEYQPEANYHSLIVYQDGQIINEDYYPEGDSISPRDVRSVTKSVVSTLIGIAIDKGFIQSENQKIGDFLSPLVDHIDEAKANITIGNLLSMSSGLEGNDLTSVPEYENWRQAGNQLQYTMSKPLICQPGDVFIYNSGASHLLSIILTRATGMSTLEFAKIYLFQPLHIKDHSWEQDQQGYYNGSAGLFLTPHDMLKIGQLYMNKGMYRSIRIVSESWINKASSFKIGTNNIEPFAPGYGYLWWIGNTQGHDYYFANGYGGQFIVVTPDINLIVVATNRWSGLPSTTANQQWYTTLDHIINTIIPSRE